MPIFYRGAGVGTYWHQNDARLTGFTSHHPGAGAQWHRIMYHIARGTTVSPYVSLTRSYGVAYGYAVAGRELPTPAKPGYVYQVLIDEVDGFGTRLIDPVQAVAENLGSPLAERSWHHDGTQEFLLGVISPSRHFEILEKPALFPPPGEGTPRPPLLSIELETLVRALRDAEVLALGAVAKAQVLERFEIHGDKSNEDRTSFAPR
ncbi:MAG: hypothetical protein HY235_14585 [Acidobacteria bacterium]|nr:hypothetical protein [Acidobacteriota bacterium]